MPRLLGGLINLRRVGGDGREGEEGGGGGPQQPRNPAAVSHAAYSADNQQDFAYRCPDFDDQPQCHCHGHQSHHHDPGSGSTYYYSQYTQQLPESDYSQQDHMYSPPDLDDQPTCHHRSRRHDRYHPSHSESAYYYGQNSQQPLDFAYGQQDRMYGASDLDDQPTCQHHRRRHRHRPSHCHRHQGHGSQQPPLPPGFGTDQAVILIPMPDGSIMAQPANYWQDRQQSVHGSSSGTSGRGQ